MSTAKIETLRRIREALRDVPPGEQPEAVLVVRDYRQVDPSRHEELVAGFAERVAEYKARVQRVSADDLPEAIARACRQQGVQRLVVPNDIPAAWLPADVEALGDPNPEVGGALSHEQLDRADGVLTGCALGIAQTGTIVLDGGPRQGRRAITLLPDYHLCVVEERQVVGLVPEAIGLLAAAAGPAHQPITFVSGPSATSDIELNRVEGVHGPRTLEVLIVATS